MLREINQVIKLQTASIGVELKYMFGAREFNHSFKNIREVVCWDISSKLKDGSQIKTSVDNDVREFQIKDDNGRKVYFLDSKSSTIKIKVICIKQYVTEVLGIKILEQE